MNKHGLGSRLRTLRKKAGLTLADLSAATNVPVSTLSKVENERASLTYEKMLALSRGLGVDIADLISRRSDMVAPSAPAGGRRSVTRASQGKQMQIPGYGYEYLNSDLKNKKITPMLITVGARTETEAGAYAHHPGEEFIYVLKGRLEFHSEHYEPLILEEGDSIYFDSTMGHFSLACGEGDALILDVCVV